MILVLAYILYLLWNALDTNIFLFLLSIFLDFIFIFSDNEEACDISVT